MLQLAVDPFYQCCGAGAVGAEIILGPGAGAENIFNRHFLQSDLRMLYCTTGSVLEQF